MGQRMLQIPKTAQSQALERVAAIFPTELGWFAIAGDARGIRRVIVGHLSREGVAAAISEHWTDWEESDWQPELRAELTRYAAGHRVTFSEFPLVRDRQTDFQHQIIQATCAIPYGKTVSYGKLAEQAGHPRAARAVGTVMSSNPFPILIPCHRVVGSGGKLGGYTSPRGLGLKEQLLAMEAAPKAAASL